MNKGDEGQYSKMESQRRFKAALQGAFTTPATPLKSMTPKRTKAQQQPAATKNKPVK